MYPARCEFVTMPDESVSEQEILQATKQHGECCDGRVGKGSGVEENKSQLATLPISNPTVRKKRRRAS